MLRDYFEDRRKRATDKCTIAAGTKPAEFPSRAIAAITDPDASLKVTEHRSVELSTAARDDRRLNSRSKNHRALASRRFA